MRLELFPLLLILVLIPPLTACPWWCLFCGCLPHHLSHEESAFSCESAECLEQPQCVNYCELRAKIRARTRHNVTKND